MYHISKNFFKNVYLNIRYHMFIKALNWYDDNVDRTCNRVYDETAYDVLEYIFDMLDNKVKDREMLDWVELVYQWHPERVEL